MNVAKLKAELSATNTNPLRETIIKILRGQKKKPTVLELANLLDRSPLKIEEEIQLMVNEGYNVEVNPEKGLELSPTLPKQTMISINTKEYFDGDRVRFGFLTDTHLCSNYECLDVLNALYDVYEREGITTVYHGGNWVDGEARFNKYDIKCIGTENQIDYFIKNYPKRKK